MTHSSPPAAVAAATAGFSFTQTMLRIRDPDRSLAFYRDVLGMTLLQRFDFPDLRFSLYFLAFAAQGEAPTSDDPRAAAEFVFRHPATLELTHNWDAEADPGFAGYHDGNTEPRGFGHIGICVPDVHAACARFERLEVSFVKRPDEGRMKGLAFIRDPDGYWIEILSASGMASLVGGAG